LPFFFNSFQVRLMSAPHFETTYALLPARFYTRMDPSPVQTPRLLKLNAELAEALGLDTNWLNSDTGLAMLAGNSFPPTAASIATVYAGHQFGYYSPQLGDGRALLIGEIVTPNLKRFDIQLKGSGPTPYSRRGDGRSALGPALREYLISEAMAALGIPTTRSLAVVSTGEWVWREPEQPGGILTRVASSHIRVGSFQFFAAQGDAEAVQHLIDAAITRHYPALKTSENPALALLNTVVQAQAKLIAQWMCVGFIHGVMNTDNMTISGETIDYGPCAFLESYDPQKVFSSIDRDGRYAFGNQPRIAQWNLARFAETLLTQIDNNPERAVQFATEAINRFPQIYEKAMTDHLRAKLGLQAEHDADRPLAQELLALMAANSADFTLTFRRLSNAAATPKAEDSLLQLFATTGGIDSWISKWRERLSLESVSQEDRFKLMNATNPAVIPRNHFVENALQAAVEKDDLEPFENLLEALTDPFNSRLEKSEYAFPPATSDPSYKTFCGT
jgi:serine/tyrosine/threonine adenylyltransferase